MLEDHFGRKRGQEENKIKDSKLILTTDKTRDSRLNKDCTNLYDMRVKSTVVM